MKRMESEASKTGRTTAAPAASSGERGRPVSEVLAYFERTTPDALLRTGLTSAGMRAGAIVRGMRRTAGFSQTALAARLGVSQARMSEIERGAGPQGPTFELLERIASECGMVLAPIAKARAEAVSAGDPPEEAGAVATRAEPSAET